ncbi:hypothetical protein V1524DRAFT_195417 [Lipomyces starkeyi]
MSSTPITTQPSLVTNYSSLQRVRLSRFATTENRIHNQLAPDEPHGAWRRSRLPRPKSASQSSREPDRNATRTTMDSEPAIQVVSEISSTRTATVSTIVTDESRVSDYNEAFTLLKDTRPEQRLHSARFMMSMMNAVLLTAEANVPQFHQVRH